MHWVLSAALYFDQFSPRTFSAACSSTRQASLSRPAEMAPRAAASQLGATSSFGGLSARAMAAGSPSIKTTTAILLAEADMISSSAGRLRLPSPYPPPLALGNRSGRASTSRLQKERKALARQKATDLPARGKIAGSWQRGVIIKDYSCWREPQARPAAEASRFARTSG